MSFCLYCLFLELKFIGYMLLFVPANDFSPNRPLKRLIVIYVYSLAELGSAGYVAKLAFLRKQQDTDLKFFFGAYLPSVCIIPENLFSVCLNLKSVRCGRGQ